MYVASATGTLVPLSAVAQVRRSATALGVNHQSQFPAVTLSFNLRPGASLGDAVDAIDRAARDIGMPVSLHGSFQGTARVFQESLANEPWLIAAALAAVYIVLGVLYESLIHPLTILSTLPSAGAGAMLALVVTGTDFTVMALIGLILLIGIVKKNAIMMIDVAIDAERRESLSPEQAIRKASLLRLRPILMTTTGGDARGIAHGPQHRHRLRAAAPAGHRDHRRAHGQPGADALHDTGALSGDGSHAASARGGGHGRDARQYPRCGGDLRGVTARRVCRWSTVRRAAGVDPFCVQRGRAPRCRLPPTSSPPTRAITCRGKAGGTCSRIRS